MHMQRINGYINNRQNQWSFLALLWSITVQKLLAETDRLEETTAPEIELASHIVSNANDTIKSIRKTLSARFNKKMF